MSKKKIFTFEECKKIAKKYNNRVDFHTNDRTCYNFSKKMGWYEKITEHMPRQIPKHRTYDEVKEAAKQYKTRMEFKKNDMNNYCFAVSHGWLDDVCSHMTVVGDRYKRCIYVYEFSDNFCYIGLTYNIDSRHIQHISGKCFSKVYEHSVKYNVSIPNPKQLTEYINKDDAAILEGEYLNKYKDNGWKIINVAKTGGLGGNKHKYDNVEITEEFCKSVAKNYNSPTEFSKNNQTLYSIMNKNGWKKNVYEVFDLEKIRKEKNKKISLTNKGKKRKVNYDKWINGCKTNKIVLQYDLDGNFIKEYPSQSHAAKLLGHPKSHGDIGKCCKGEVKKCLGYVWKYKK